MKGELNYELGQNAYVKLVLHALKHKATPVNGVLIGPSTADGDMVEISDAVPLLHSKHIALLPSLEIALLQIEEFYGGQGLGVVGYFHANERFDEYEHSGVAKNIGDHIYRYFPQAAVLLLDNRKLEAFLKAKDSNPVMQGNATMFSNFTLNKNCIWFGSEGSAGLNIREPPANVVLLDYIATQKWEEIVDFADHFNDISMDWLNTGLFE